ncbi:DUF6895 family protein, partial [Streptomyces pharetrae]|uniref:DUF6895 family protein n=1 Tax=Streptomyces pharetrae TaxID=291370 RepID=UPI003F4E1A32
MCVTGDGEFTEFTHTVFHLTHWGEKPEGLPRYLLRGPARGPLASGPGMTVAPCRTDDLGGGV